MCVRLIWDCMKLFATAAKLFVWWLRLRVQHGHPVADTGCTKSKICFLLQIFGDRIRYWALRWQRHSETNAISRWNHSVRFLPGKYSFQLKVFQAVVLELQNIILISEKLESPGSGKKTKPWKCNWEVRSCGCQRYVKVWETQPYLSNNQRNAATLSSRIPRISSPKKVKSQFDSRKRYDTKFASTTTAEAALMSEPLAIEEITRGVWQIRRTRRWKVSTR